MLVQIDTIYEDGVFKPQEKIELPEHSRCKIMILSPMKQVDSLKKLALQQREAIKDLVGIKASGFTNVSKNHDRYLYYNEEP